MTTTPDPTPSTPAAGWEDYLLFDGPLKGRRVQLPVASAAWPIPDDDSDETVHWYRKDPAVPRQALFSGTRP